MERSDLYSDDLNYIRNRYKYTIRDGDYGINNICNYYYFCGVLDNTGLDVKFEQLKKKIENDQIKLNGNQKIEKKKKLEKLIEEYNDIKIKAKDTLDYSDKLLLKIEGDYLKNKNKEGIKEYYDKICRGILDSAIEKYIRFEKSIIIIVDNVHSLYF